jgi:hypothetical protein
LISFGRMPFSNSFSAAERLSFSRFKLGFDMG